MLKGKIILNKKTSNLCIDGKLPTQNFVKIKQSDIKKFELKEEDIVEYDGIPYQTVNILNKIFDLQVQFIFDGKIQIKAESKEEAEKICSDSFGIVAGGNFHCNDNNIIDWDYNIHPEQIIISKNQKG